MAIVGIKGISRKRPVQQKLTALAVVILNMKCHKWSPHSTVVQYKYNMLSTISCQAADTVCFMTEDLYYRWHKHTKAYHIELFIVTMKRLSEHRQAASYSTHINWPGRRPDTVTLPDGPFTRCRLCWTSHRDWVWDEPTRTQDYRMYYTPCHSIKQTIHWQIWSTFYWEASSSYY